MVKKPMVKKPMVKKPEVKISKKEKRFIERDHRPLKLVALMKKYLIKKVELVEKLVNKNFSKIQVNFIQSKYFFMMIKILFNII